MGSSKDSSVDGKLRKLKITCDAKPPDCLNEILDLCKERLNRSVSPRATGAPLQSLPHLKPAPFITNPKHPGPPSAGITTPQTPAPSVSGAVVMTPISPNLPQQQPPPGHSLSSPLAPGSQPPNMVQPSPSIQSPKNVATVNRMPLDPTKVRGPGYSTGYIVPPQQINPAAQRPPQQRMSVPMMQLGQGTQQSPIMPQPGGIIRGPIMHMQTQPQQLRPVSSAGRIDQTMNNPRPNPGMMMPQQYPRSYQYPNVQQIPRSYVDPGGFIPVQQRPAQVLQISLPPNMNPQAAARQARPTLGPNPGIAPPHQGPLHRVPYNQMQLGNMPNTNMPNANMPNTNMPNANMQNPNIYNQYR